MYMITIEKDSTDELISKKELLALTKISYGQLYRWKRMNIIPENWFIKKSMPTGQETFFKKAQILERIETILSMKDDVSLDEIANLFNQEETEQTITLSELQEKNTLNKTVIDMFSTVCPNKQLLGKKDLILVNLIEKYLINSVITLDELKNLATMIDAHYTTLYNSDGKLILYRKLGVAIIIGCKTDDCLLIDPQAVKIIEVNLQKEFSEISRKLI